MRSTRSVQSSRPRPAVAPIVPGHGIDTAIGRTPVARLRRVVEPDMAEVWVKLEGADPCIRVRIGTGGTISGVGRYLKERRPE
jgi:cysteine synthase